MCLVGLPESVYKRKETVDYSSAETIQNTLYHDYNIEVQYNLTHATLLLQCRGSFI